MKCRMNKIQEIILLAAKIIEVHLVKIVLVLVLVKDLSTVVWAGDYSKLDSEAAFYFYFVKRISSAWPR